MTLHIKTRGKYLPVELLLENDNGMVVTWDHPSKVIAITKAQIKELESQDRVKIDGHWLSIRK